MYAPEETQVPTQLQVGVDGEVIFEVGAGVMPTLAATGPSFGASFGAKSGGGFWASLGSYAHTSSYYPEWYSEKRYRVLNLEQEVAANQQLTWQRVNDLYSHIHDEHYTMGALPSALIGLTVTFLTQGAGASLMGSVMGSGSTAATGAAGAATATTTSMGLTFATGALQGAISYSASLTAMNMANGVMNGELTNPLAGFSVRNLAVQMASYGGTDALSSGMLKDLQASLKIEEDTRKLLAGITAHSAAQSAIGGQDLGRALVYNLTTQSAQFGATRMAGVIKGHYDPSGNKELGLNYVSHKLAHGISAAGFGGLSAAVLGEDVGRSMLMAGCGAAVGEALGEGLMKLSLKEGEVIPLREYHTMRERVVFASQMGACLATGMISTAMYGDDDAAAYGLTAETALARDLHFATTAADIAVRHNCLFLIPIVWAGLNAALTTYEAYEIYALCAKGEYGAAITQFGEAAVLGIIGAKGAQMALKQSHKLVQSQAIQTFVKNWRPHGTSKAYIGDTHVYVIRDAHGTAYKIGESMQGVNQFGQSIRAESQIAKMARQGQGRGFESEVRRNFTTKADARSYETQLIQRFRGLYGADKLPGNKGVH